MPLMAVVSLMFVQATSIASDGNVQVVAVGDLMLGRGLAPLMDANGPTYPLAAVRNVLADADLAIANLECVLSERGSARSKQFVLRAHPRAIEALTDAGLDLLVLANNHTLDFGGAALADTFAALEGQGLAYVGAGRTREAAYAPVIKDHHGVRIGTLAYSLAFDDAQELAEATVASAAREEVRRTVAAARTRADIVVVSFHWGFGDRHVPTARQESFARLAIDAGASLVFGHHSHVLQPLEAYHGGFIAYGLGNFVFDNPALAERQSIILRLKATKTGIESVEVLPVLIVDGQPRPAGVDGGAILELLERISQGRGVTIERRATEAPWARVAGQGRP